MKDKEIKISSFYKMLNYLFYRLYKIILIIILIFSFINRDLKIFMKFGIFFILYLLVTKKYVRYKYCYVIFKSDELYISYLKEKKKLVFQTPKLKIGYAKNDDRIIKVSIKYKDIKKYGFKRNLDEYKTKINDIGIITNSNKRYVIKESEYTKRQLDKILSILDEKVNNLRITN